MPARTTCPDCRRDLRVQDNLLGEQVRCPHCGTQFAARAGVGRRDPPATEAPADESPLPPADLEPPPDAPDPEAFRPAASQASEEAAASGPMPLPPRPDLDLQDDDEEELEDERWREEHQRRVERASHQHARNRVMPPAICLIVAASINIGFDVLRLIMLGVQAALMPAPPPPPPGAAPIGDKAFFLGMSCGSIAISFAWSALVMNAGIQLKRLRNYPMVLLGAIVAMLPCVNGCCFLSLPIAIWTMVLIHDGQVRRHFAP